MAQEYTYIYPRSLKTHQSHISEKFLDQRKKLQGKGFHHKTLHLLAHSTGKANSMQGTIQRKIKTKNKRQDPLPQKVAI